MGGSSKIGLAVLALVVAVLVAFSLGPLVASDHDDGEVELKGRNLNLTDLYIFREIDQNPSAFSNDLILIMNTNPRSVARQQYYFSTLARYEFRITRVGNNDDPVTGKPDVILRFDFEKPDLKMRQQEFNVTAIKDGRTILGTGGTFRTTPLGKSPVINDVNLGGTGIDVFAGLREDPFFFDVEQYFRVRAGALDIGPDVGFRDPGLDFTAGYNVNAIVVRVPRSFLRGPTSATTFDVWETISVQSAVPAVADAAVTAAGEFVQVERLARPAINEGLVVTNEFLNALNRIGPDCEADALKGKEPCASAAKPILAEAAATLAAFGNSPDRIGALVGAFLPDVNRIDTTGPSGYAAAVNKRGSPIRGRKITDDVIDITLTVLTNGAITTDHVSYTGPNRGGSRHKSLLSRFPYLAAPN